MNRLLNYLDKILCAVLAIFIVMMLSVGSMQVFYRYILRNSLSWSEELMRYMYVWVTMLGISMGIRRKGLSCISSFTDFVEKKSKLSRHLLAAAGFIFQIIVFLLMTVYGAKLCMLSAGQMSPALRISMGIIYMAMPVGGGLALLYSANEIISYTKQARGGERE